MKKTFSVLFLIAVSLACQAQSVPSLVNYQGRLANAGGSPLPTADYPLTFKIYDAAANGNLVWGPQIFDGQVAPGHGSLIPAVQGYFNVMLGPADTNGASLANAFTASNRYVEITVSNNPPIAPRQQILSAPFAFQAANATTAGTAAQLSGMITGAQIASNTITAGQIALGAIQTGSLGAGIVTLTNLAPRQLGTNFAGVGGVAMSPVISTSIANPGYSGTAVPGLTVTLVTTGRPVMVVLNNGNFKDTASSGGGWGVEIFFIRNGIQVGDEQSFMEVGTTPNGALPANAFHLIDLPPAGTNTYTINIGNYPSNGSDTEYINGVQLVAFEF